MPLERIEGWGYRCRQCGHTWVPRGLGTLDPTKPPPKVAQEPKLCPKCKSLRWDRGSKTDRSEATTGTRKKKAGAIKT